MKQRPMTRRCERHETGRVPGLWFGFAALFIVLFASGVASSAATLPIPNAQQSWTYPPQVLPAPSSDPSVSAPLGVGPVAVNGDTVSVCLDSGQFSEAVAVYLGVYAPSIDFSNIYVVDSDYLLRALPLDTLSPVSPVIAQWKNDVTAVNECIFGDIPVSSLPDGIHYLFLMVKPENSLTEYYLWEPYFIVTSTAAPGNFSLTAQFHCNGRLPSVTLNWSPSSGATSYDVYRDGVIIGAGAAGLGFIDDAPVAGQTYTYYVVANNANGSSLSNNAMVTVPPLTACISYR